MFRVAPKRLSIMVEEEIFDDDFDIELFIKKLVIKRFKEKLAEESAKESAKEDKVLLYGTGLNEPRGVLKL